MTNPTVTNIELHWIKRRWTVARLINSGRRDPTIMSVLLTESYFRPPVWRGLEYLAWLMLRKLVPARAARLTLGLAQVSFKAWKAHRPLENWGVLTSLKHFSSLEDNYDVCDDYLRGYGPPDSLSNRRVAALYVGEARKYYIDVMAAFRE